VVLGERETTRRCWNGSQPQLSCERAGYGLFLAACSRHSQNPAGLLGCLSGTSGGGGRRPRSRGPSPCGGGRRGAGSADRRSRVAGPMCSLQLSWSTEPPRLATDLFV
jgi:hypothetical protein